MSLFRLDASIRVEGSNSHAIADIVEQEWRNARPGEAVIRRHVGVDPIPATAWAAAGLEPLARAGTTRPDGCAASSLMSGTWT
jgi:FMN-dependent NADH-azoreductase